MSDAVLAIEWSSCRLSMAWRTEVSTREKVLELKRFQAELALPALEDLLTQLPADAEIVEIRVGRGPGNYSGIRQALAWSIGYCAPGGVRLKTASSGRAQARRLSAGVDGPFAVLGDARRGLWWGAVFGRGTEEWEMRRPEEWAAGIGTLPVFSQEAGRLRQARFSLREDYPSAMDLLDLPEDLPSEEAAPLYLHPAV